MTTATPSYAIEDTENLPSFGDKDTNIQPTNKKAKGGSRGPAPSEIQRNPKTIKMSQYEKSITDAVHIETQIIIHGMTKSESITAAMLLLSDLIKKSPHEAKALLKAKLKLIEDSNKE